MGRIYDPAQLTHLRLRDFAVVAAWIAPVDESTTDLEDLPIDLPPEARDLPDFSTPWSWDAVMGAASVAWFSSFVGSG